ncbi:unnamed protein product [Heligmosomoides polygyrus]|uniref:Uncharacterized protein n=1 Tax=Heligmosomoides polygyrus TaxID=6339 RepID=A0A3P7WS78_HELPZ|nr:unnamed protein product [Heligmosomoides polygyrus]
MTEAMRTLKFFEELEKQSKAAKQQRTTQEHHYTERTLEPTKTTERQIPINEVKQKRSVPNVEENTTTTIKFTTTEQTTTQEKVDYDDDEEEDEDEESVDETFGSRVLVTQQFLLNNLDEYARKGHYPYNRFNGLFPMIATSNGKIKFAYASVGGSIDDSRSLPRTITSLLLNIFQRQKLSATLGWPLLYSFNGTTYRDGIRAAIKFAYASVGGSIDDSRSLPRTITSLLLNIFQRQKLSATLGWPLLYSFNGTTYRDGIRAAVSF